MTPAGSACWASLSFCFTVSTTFLAFSLMRESAMPSVTSLPSRVRISLFVANTRCLFTFYLYCGPSIHGMLPEHAALTYPNGITDSGYRNGRIAGILTKFAKAFELPFQLTQFAYTAGDMADVLVEQVIHAPAVFRWRILEAQQ